MISIITVTFSSLAALISIYALGRMHGFARAQSFIEIELSKKQELREMLEESNRRWAEYNRPWPQKAPSPPKAESVDAPYRDMPAANCARCGVACSQCAESEDPDQPIDPRFLKRSGALVMMEQARTVKVDRDFGISPGTNVDDSTGSGS